MDTNQQLFDRSGLKTGLVLTIVLLIAAFVLDLWWLVAFVAVAQLLSALDAPFAPYRLIYRHIVKSTGLVKPRIVQENTAPHRFASLVGALFNGTGALLLAAGVGAGWVLVGIVVVLANLNFWVSFCLGCWMYLQFNRLGVPGFRRERVGES